MICSDAPKLLKMRREVAASDLSPKVIKSLMDCIDLIRWNHEGESPKCECWQKSRRAAGPIGCERTAA